MKFKSGDAAAKFVVPEPYAFSFTVSTPGSDSGGGTIDTAKMDSAGRFEILAKVADITARILLIPNSYKFDSIAIVYHPVYHGVVRTTDGIPQIVERPYDIGVVHNGGCAFSPDRYLNLATRYVGCVFPKYDRHLIYSLQVKLRKLGFFKISTEWGVSTSDYCGYKTLSNVEINPRRRNSERGAS